MREYAKTKALAVTQPADEWDRSGYGITEAGFTVVEGARFYVEDRSATRVLVEHAPFPGSEHTLAVLRLDDVTLEHC